MIPVSAVMELGIKLMLAGMAAWENRETAVSEEKLLALRASLKAEHAKWTDLFPDLFPAAPAAPDTSPPGPTG